MQTSVFIARLIGPVMLVIGLAVFANQRAFRDMSEEFMASRALMFLGGLLVMPVGLAIVLTHNIWTTDWGMLITLFGLLPTIACPPRPPPPLLLLRLSPAPVTQPPFPP